MTRILVDVPDNQLASLNEIATVERMPRAEVIRLAIAAYVERNSPPTSDAFGIWAGKKKDGLAYQESIRAEW